MTKNNAAQSNENVRREEPKLDSRYGEIGISAVAAALQYANGAKNGAKTDAVKTGADAPVDRQQDKWLAELAA